MSTEMDHEPSAVEATRQHMDEWQRGEASHVGEEGDGSAPISYLDVRDGTPVTTQQQATFLEANDAYARGVVEGRRQAAEEIANEIEDDAGSECSAVVARCAEIARRLGPCHEKGSTDG